MFVFYWPVSVYHQVKYPCGAACKASTLSEGKRCRLNAHTELYVKPRRSAQEMVYRNRPILMPDGAERPALIVSAAPLSG